MLFAAGEITSTSHSGQTNDATTAPTTAPSTASPEAGSEGSEEPAPGTRRAVERIARQFVGDYIDVQLPREEWLDMLGHRATPALAAALESVEQGNLEAGRRVVRVKAQGVGATAASVEVTTDGGAFTVDLAHSGVRWEVTRVLPADPDAGESTEDPADN
ncbi:hypothetical protein HNR19_000289 [Nocardioides thalensis]|uniref:Nuclear transport factor 2 family protein n=1 Tax=Nocardioides thalensis TaxID=1914755 RepID=A0A853BX99_9ACTN|nr:hypothetical protein [Nocardioides thalensis]NYI99590.1 hypothetical protein [Nocardioides thalensis]